jgi:hypothetical protein
VLAAARCAEAQRWGEYRLPLTLRLWVLGALASLFIASLIHTIRRRLRLVASG